MRGDLLDVFCEVLLVSENGFGRSANWLLLTALILLGGCCLAVVEGGFQTAFLGPARCLLERRVFLVPLLHLELEGRLRGLTLTHEVEGGLSRIYRVLLPGSGLILKRAKELLVLLLCCGEGTPILVEKSTASLVVVNAVPCGGGTVTGNLLLCWLGGVVLGDLDFFEGWVGVAGRGKVSGVLVD